MTNDLLILGKPYPKTNPSFRGISRDSPVVPMRLDKSNPLHQLLFWKGTHPGLTVQDVEKAHHLIKLLVEQIPPEHYELFELTENNLPPLIGDKFFGFDLAIDLNQSLLELGLIFNQNKEGLDNAHQALIPLLQLVTQFFRPQLNVHGLFDEYALAEFCLDCLLSLQRFVPNIWDSWEGNYRVVGIWRIS